MFPEIVIVVSGTHWQCVTCKLHNKRTVSLDHHLQQKHPFLPQIKPTSTTRPAAVLSDGEDYEDIPQEHKKSNNPKPSSDHKSASLSPISPYKKKLQELKFDEDEDDNEFDDIDNDDDSDEDFIPPELESKIKPTPRSRRKTRVRTKRSLKPVRLRISKKALLEQKEPEALSTNEVPTESEQTEDEAEDEAYRFPTRQKLSKTNVINNDGEGKPKAKCGKKRTLEPALHTQQNQPPRKRGRPPKPRPPPGEGDELTPKRPYRKRIPDASEMLLKIRNVGRKPNTRKKIQPNERPIIKDKYLKFIDKSELAEFLNMCEQNKSVEEEDSSSASEIMRRRNSETMSINQDSMSSQGSMPHMYQQSQKDGQERGTVRCSICLYLFSSQRLLRDHTDKVASLDVFQCRKCEMKFHGITDLNMHVFCDHEYEKQPMCFSCSEEFKSMERLEKHLYRHNQNSDPKLADTRFHDCRLCGMELNIDFQLIKNHYYRRHKAYVCPECYGKTTELLFYTDTILYSEHKLMHANSPAECAICKLVFPTAREMKLHMWAHAEDKTEDGTGGKCTKCDKWLPNAGCMLMHEKEHKNEAIRKNYALEASIGFPCMRCEHIFSSKSNLKKHSCKADPNRTFYFHCEYCGHGCNTKEQLRDHIALHHLGIKRYACDYCDQRFVCAPTLRRHVRRQHTHEKPYECHLCGERFYERNLMLRHVSKHTGIASFMCEFCGKGFHTKFDLKKHVENHTNTRDFVCANCGLDYKRSYHLKRHIEKGCKKTLLQYSDGIPSANSENPDIGDDDDDHDDDDDDNDEEVDLDMDNEDFNGDDADMDNFNDESSGPDYDDDDEDIV